MHEYSYTSICAFLFSFNANFDKMYYNRQYNIIVYYAKEIF